MAERGFASAEYKVSETWLNILGILLSAGITLGLILPFNARFQRCMITWDVPSILIAGGFILLSFPVSQLLRGLTWSLFLKGRLNDVVFAWDPKAFALTAYTMAPLTKAGFIASMIMPFLLLGIVPTIFAFFNGLFWLLFAGILNMVVASSEVTVALVALTKTGNFFHESPEAAGFTAFTRRSVL